MPKKFSFLLVIFLIVLVLLVGSTMVVNAEWTLEPGKRVEEPYFFDVCVVRLDNGAYRMYGELYGDIVSYISSDGLNWQEEGVRLLRAGFPFVMRLPDGRWRMYYCPMDDSQRCILSAVSVDGLNFIPEAGHRYDATGSCEERIQSPRVIIMDDGTYRMYFTGIQNEGTPEETVSILSAVSHDGMSFSREQGVRIDPSSYPLVGTRAAHAWPVKLADGKIKLYFAGATTTGGGIISAISTNGLDFTINPVPEIPNWSWGKDVQDPCVVFMNDGIRLYYGLYSGPQVIPESGIYSAISPYPPLPMPQGKNSFMYRGKQVPMKDLTPSTYKPVGIGINSHDKIDIFLSIPAMSGPADVYFGLYAPVIDEQNIYVLLPNMEFQPLSVGIVPWKEAYTESIERILFGDISTLALPQGVYYLITMVTPHANMENYYIWIGTFTLPFIGQ